ncbi:MAG: DUF4136 domain-containing protein [Sphingomonadales bacterium]|jgi:hypothetical protein
MLKSLIKLGFLPVALSLLGACSTPKFEADVVRFHTLSAANEFQNKSITVVPQYEEQNGLEFSSYADAVGQKLAGLGFTPAANQEEADFLAVLDYNIQPRAAVDERRDSPVSVGVGVGGVGSHVGVSVGTIFGVGERKPDTYYSRYLGIKLQDRTNNQIIYEGRVTSEGKEGNPSLILPVMIDALFSEFPGPSGVTTEFETRLEPKQ